MNRVKGWVHEDEIHNKQGAWTSLYVEEIPTNAVRVEVVVQPCCNKSDCVVKEGVIKISLKELYHLNGKKVSVIIMEAVE